MAKFEATFEDSYGKTAVVPFHAANSTAGKAMADAIAAKSDCKWIALHTLERVTITGTSPGSGKSVVVKSKSIYSTATPGVTISLEIPGIKSSVVQPGAPTPSSTDPISGATTKLTTKKGTAAVTLRGTHSIGRNRKL